MKIRKRLPKALIIFSIFLNAYIFGSIHLSFAACPSGMIAYWKMEEDATIQEFTGYLDETKSVNNGLCVTSCPTITSRGIVDNGQKFNGINTGIDFSANAIFDFGESDSFTIELWFKLQNISAREVLIGKTSTTSSMNWWLGVQPSGRIAFSLTSTEGVSELIESSSQKVIVNDLWHHVAVVRYNNQTRLYVDGILEDSITRVYEHGFESSGPINIGYLNDGAPIFHFSGTLDEIAIYDLPLPEKEIQMHYYLSRGYCEAHDSPVRIMPLGDSITFDSRTGENRPISERTGYRWPLWNWLNKTGYWVDFIGSEQSGGEIFDDPDNAGFPGISDTELWELIRTGYDPHDAKQVTPGPYFNDYPSDVILLHIGTNYVRTETVDVENILNEIDGYDPNITVILARIINRVGGSTTTTQFNNNLSALAQNRILNGDKIIVIDMEYGSGIVYQIEPDGDMHDTLHPSNVSNPDIIDSGYAKMAYVWYNALDSFLPQPSTDCPDGISSLWALDESSGDLFVDSVNGNHGLGAVSPAPATGKVNSAQEFNGIDTGINVPADDSFNWAYNASFSIEYWTKRANTAFSDNEVIIGRDDGVVSEMHWWTGLWTNGKAAFVLKGTNGAGGGSKETGDYLEGKDDLTDGTWHHIAVVRDSATNENRLYVDGVLNDSVSIAYGTGEGFRSETSYLNMGWLNSGAGYHYTGTLDEVATYNRVLTIVEIQQHFNDGLSYCGSTITPPDDGGGGGGCFIDTSRY